MLVEEERPCLLVLEVMRLESGSSKEGFLDGIHLVRIWKRAYRSRQISGKMRSHSSRIYVQLVWLIEEST